MANLTRLRVHVCPIGYEEDRIAESAIKLRADRLWLITEKNPSKENAFHFITEVTSKLEQNEIEVRKKGVSRNDLFDNLKGIKDIFSEEQGNDIHVNVSAGSKIQAIAGMMACMMFKEFHPTPYYVEPQKYGRVLKSPQSSGVKDIVRLPDYAIQKPKTELISALSEIQKKTKLNKKELAEVAIKKSIIDSKNDKVSQSDYAKLDHNIIRPLKETWKFITVTQTGRNHWIELTDSGRDACKFLT